MYRRDSRQDTHRKNDRDEIDDKRRKEEDEYYKIRSKVEAKIKEEEVMKKVKQEERLSSEEEEKGTEHIESEENVEDYNKETLKVEPPKYERQDILAERKYVNQNANQQGVTWNQQPQNNYSYDPQFQGQYQSLANDPSNCKFYMKTGACRFGPRCSRNHLRFENTQTILIPNFFHDPRLGAPMGNEMEYDEVDMIHEFEKFYDDVIGEFRAAGNVTMFKCCQNYVPHLRGNVYVQYSKPEEAIEALNMFNGRFYAGRQLTVELCPVTNWKSSICGLFDKRLCPRGKACNFLHVFRNPGNAYSVPNRTDFDPERAFRSGGYDPSFVNPNHPVFKYYNQRDAYGYRSENAKQNRISSTNDRNKWDKVKNERSHSRSRSRDRDRTSRKRHYSRSRSRSRGRSRSRSHSRSRSRSRSRRRKHSRSSRSSSRSHSYSKKKSKRSRKYSHSSNSSHGSPKKKATNNDSDVSDTSTDWSDISLDP